MSLLLNGRRLVAKLKIQKKDYVVVLHYWKRSRAVVYISLTISTTRIVHHGSDTDMELQTQLGARLDLKEDYVKDLKAVI
jgi:hypothetical protein